MLLFIFFSSRSLSHSLVRRPPSGDESPARKRDFILNFIPLFLPLLFARQPTTHDALESKSRSIAIKRLQPSCCPLPPCFPTAPQRGDRSRGRIFARRRSSSALLRSFVIMTDYTPSASHRIASHDQQQQQPSIGVFMATALLVISDHVYWMIDSTPCRPSIVCCATIKVIYRYCSEK